MVALFCWILRLPTAYDENDQLVGLRPVERPPEPALHEGIERDHRVAKPADDVHHRDSAVLHGVQLVQPARLEPRRHEQDVRPCSDPVCHLHRESNPPPDLVVVLPVELAQHILQVGPPGAQHHQLCVLPHDPRHRLRNEVDTLLVILEGQGDILQAHGLAKDADLDSTSDSVESSLLMQESERGTEDENAQNHMEAKSDGVDTVAHNEVGNVDASPLAGENCMNVIVVATECIPWSKTVEDFFHVDLPDQHMDHFKLYEPMGGDHFNIFAVGLKIADRVITVSHGYAWELTTSEDGWGLHEIINKNNWKIQGIVNGIDTEDWNPELDLHLRSDGYTNYSIETLQAGKPQCKTALQKELGLPVHEDVPLIGFIGRLDHQKGVDLIAEAMPWIVGQDAQLVMLGTGRADLEDMLRKFDREHHDKATGRVGFSVKMAHRIIVGEVNHFCRESDR
ncbi:hypothetical protein OPV22_013009 [Ensete ventricosum]|uniref:Starch synthase catalytic domain-containing protein n=1 Tax=Ensete ventricosum TaxID=4639 RepID=A0AAV8PI45_ENSVE|nr:hypothetical protein OPV22_013009 [Ensete ventricosum]